MSYLQDILYESPRCQHCAAGQCSALAPCTSPTCQCRDCAYLRQVPSSALAERLRSAKHAVDVARELSPQKSPCEIRNFPEED